MIKINLKLFLLIFLFCPQIILGCCFDTTPTSEILNGITRPNDITFSPSGNCLAVANRTGDPLTDTVKIYAFDKDNCIVINPNNPVTTLTNTNGIDDPFALRFSPNGECLIVVNRNSGTVTSYSVNLNNCQVTTTPVSTISGLDTPFSLAISPNGNCIAVGDRDLAEVRIYDLNQETCSIGPNPISPILTNAEGINFPRSLAFSNDGSCLAVVNFSPNGLSVFPINVSNCQATIPASSTINFSSNEQGHSVVFSPSDNCIAYSKFVISNINPLIAIYDFNKNNCTVTLPEETIFTSADGIAASRSISFSPDGTCFAIANFGDFDGTTVTIYSIDNCTVTNPDTPISTLPAELPFVIAFSPDGSCIAVANQPSQGTIGGPDFISIFKKSIQVTITSDKPVICNGETTTLTANIIGGASPFSFQWFLNNTLIAGATSSVLNITSPGTYTVIVTDANGCSGTDSLNITVNDIAVTISAADSCQANTTLTANVIGGVSPFNFQWFLNNTLIAGATSAVLNTSQAGTYSVNVTDANNCTVTDSINIGNIEVTIISDKPVICNGETATLTANIIGGVSPFNFQWFLNNTLIAGATSSVLNTASPGTYTVIVTDANGCSVSSASFDITSASCCIKPDANALSIAICQKYRNPSL